MPDERIEIFSAEACPYAQRSRMVLHEKDVPYDLTEIDLANKPDWFKDISPYGKVPVMRHRGRVIYESAIINEYLEEVFAEPALMPQDPGQRAEARIWIDFIGTRIAEPMFYLLIEKDAETRAGHEQKFREEVRFLEQHGLGEDWSGPYWFGPELSLVDISLYPYFDRLCLLSHYRNVELPADCKRLRTWYNTMCKHQAAIATSRGDAFYVRQYEALVA